jgi:two-component system response regulator HydG
MSVAFFECMKKNVLFVQVIDPSGHRRVLKLSDFPFFLGTDLLERNALRDPKLLRKAMVIEETLALKVLQENLLVQLGDLQLQALKLPLLIPMKIGDTELTFSENEFRTDTIDFPPGEQAWYTESAAGLSLLQTLKRASQTKLSIYLTGETGTGKEVLGKLAHLWSERSTGAFVPINCGALPLTLVESELFGHTKGSFTGATRDRPGAFLQAHGGTLFLDEVGDLPPEVQVKILRFLESGEIRPVGSDRTLFADVRIICATHKPLARLVKEGKFRQDLYFRLASIPVEIPCLRSRLEDVKALAGLFAREHQKIITNEAVVRLQSYPWPGNVRELRHAIERACGLVGPAETVIHAKDFDFLLEQPNADEEEQMTLMGSMALPGILSLKEMEKILILRALKITKGNRTDAAKVLGIARSTLFEMIKRHEIVGPKSNDYWMERMSSNS